jgi:cytochrome c-type biogenesis protein CcmH/NrfF
MVHSCDKALPCSQHITILLWILGLLVTVLSSTVYGVIDNRNKSVDEHKVMIQYRQEGDILLRAEQTKSYSEIIQRLARIEEKVSKL